MEGGPVALLPPPLADLEARLGVPAGELVGEDAARALAALSDVTEDALSLVPDATAAAWRADAPGVVAVVILRAARREYNNPEGLVSEGVGERSATVGTASAYLTPDEVRRVLRAAGRRSFVGTLRVTSGWGVG